MVKKQAPRIGAFLQSIFDSLCCNMQIPASATLYGSRFRDGRQASALHDLFRTPPASVLIRVSRRNFSRLSCRTKKRPYRTIRVTKIRFLTGEAIFPRLQKLLYTSYFCDINSMQRVSEFMGNGVVCELRIFFRSSDRSSRCVFPTLYAQLPESRAGSLGHAPASARLSVPRGISLSQASGKIWSYVQGGNCSVFRIPTPPDDRKHRVCRKLNFSPSHKS